jgi:hypothetical protein
MELLKADAVMAPACVTAAAHLQQVVARHGGNPQKRLLAPMPIRAVHLQQKLPFGRDETDDNIHSALVDTGPKKVARLKGDAESLLLFESQPAFDRCAKRESTRCLIG